MERECFEKLLASYRVVVERYINYRMPSRFDADDVIQETYFVAYKNFNKLKNIDYFKSWLLSIARNQCNLWYRKHYRCEFESLDQICDCYVSKALSTEDDICDILEKLPFESAQLFKMVMNGYKQSEIAERLGIPIGTVKSRMHNARKQFRSLCAPEEIIMFEKGRKAMEKKDHTCGFPIEMPNLVIKETNHPFVEVKCADESFIIPRLGNKNSEGTYRYPDMKLALVSTCYVPKVAVIHEAVGVKVCRDTYNVKANRLYKNECVWFSQLTDEYIRDLGTIVCDSKADDDFPTEIHTFLEEDYDVIVNGNDKVHGRPLLIRENPPKVKKDGSIFIDEYNVRYTFGMYDVTIGTRTFKTLKYLLLQNADLVTENYVDITGRLVLLRWYESDDITERDGNGEGSDTPFINLNGKKYVLIEDRISQYAL